MRRQAIRGWMRRSVLVCMVVAVLLTAFSPGVGAESGPGDVRAPETTAPVQIPIGTLTPLPTIVPQRPTPTPGPPLGVPSPTPVPTEVPSLPTDVPEQPTVAPTQAPVATPPVVPPPIGNVTPPPDEELDPSQYGTVTLNVRLCPPTFYGGGALNSAYPQICTISPYWAWVGASSQNSGTPVLNIVADGASRSWNLLPGKIEIRAGQAGGYTFVRTVCQTAGVAGVFDAQSGGYAGKKLIDLAGGQHVTCTWFVSTTPVATGTINVTLYECTTVPPRATETSVRKTCTAPMDDVRIWQNDLADEPSDKESNWSGYTGAAGAGMVSFPTTPAGMYQVHAALIPYGQDPAGAMVVGFCTGQPMATLSAQTGWFPVTLPPGGTVSCDLFFIPGRG